jgi:ribosomal protein S12 methylthiotransferase accessory factor YcaO
LDYSSTARIPTVICLLKNRGGLWCGGSTATTLEGALQRAVSEAFATYLWVQQETVRGGYRLTKESIDALKPGFTDESATAYNRVFSYSNSYFVSKLSLAVLTNTQPIAYTTQYDMLDTTHDYLADAVTRFGDIVTYEATNDYLEEYDYQVCRVVVPQSYYFALDERYSRPLLQDGRCPQNTHINPFP